MNEGRLPGGRQTDGRVGRRSREQVAGGLAGCVFDTFRIDIANGHELDTLLPLQALHIVPALAAATAGVT